MHWLLRVGLALALFACSADEGGRDHIAAATLFTQAYERQELTASVGGADCRVLCVDVQTRLDDAMVESMHYGTGPYVAFGGVEEFAKDRGFRAVVYRDAAEHLWTYGSMTLDEARSMPRCR